MIEVRHISKSFNGVKVLHDISATFDAGKTNLIIGQSGSGKTVLMKSIIGIHRVDEGDILYGNSNFTSMNSKEVTNLRKEIGMLFQGSALFDSMTVEENVRFPLEMFSNKPKGEWKERVDFCLNRVGLSHAAKLYPAEISGGMQKRAAIARAIVLQPTYLFCDEPNSGLDPKTSQTIDQLIREITYESNMTTIINTHDMNSVMEIGDKVLFIHEGRKSWEGQKETIFDSNNEDLNALVFASSLFQKVKKYHNMA
ncbi:MAG: ATP-binding cassette domain-containing protein [Paludibacteraceae bacterium]|jgi:phospholipid/cholesterol/gamma-HCH transport system ATP-binding protein|nr:ATP-binding cassette domain-containing protein [Paludibacteraceae bacterium]OQA49562.1 MAG: Methionine import ATP-binding protein MetN 2 [Bacteroidetes bacterium ADurb.Bin302]